VLDLGNLRAEEAEDPGHRGEPSLYCGAAREWRNWQTRWT